MDIKQKMILEESSFNKEQQINNMKILYEKEQKDIFNQKINDFHEQIKNLNEAKSVLTEQIKTKNQDLEEQNKKIIVLSKDNDDKEKINHDLKKTIELLNNKMMNVIPLEEQNAKIKIFNTVLENFEDLKTHPLIKNKMTENVLKIAHYNSKEYLDSSSVHSIKDPPSNLLFVLFDRGSRNGQNNVYTLKDLKQLKNDSFANMYVFWKTILSKEQIFQIDYLLELKNMGFNLEKLKNMGYSGLELKNVGYSAKELKDAGFALEDLRVHHEGFSVEELKNVGFTFSEMLLSTKSVFYCDELKLVGVTIKDLRNAGFDDKYIMNHYFFTEKEIQESYH